MYRSLRSLALTIMFHMCVRVRVCKLWAPCYTPPANKQRMHASAALFANFDPTLSPTEPGEELMVMTFTNCTFEDMTQRADSPRIPSYPGMFTAKGASHNLIFDNCIFRNISYPGSLQSPTGWLIQMDGGTLEVRNSCFYNNTFIGWGAINAFGSTILIQEGNFAEPPHLVPSDPRLFGEGSVDEDELSVVCSWIAKSASLHPQNVSDVTCEEATEPMCLSTRYKPTINASKDDNVGNASNVSSSSGPTSSGQRLSLAVLPWLMVIVIMRTAYCPLM